MPALTKNLALLGHAGYAQAAVITAGSEQAAYPAANLQTTALWGQVWRSAPGAVTSVQVKWDLGAAQSLQGVALLGTNLTTAATRSIVLSNNPDLSSPLVTVSDSAAFDGSVPGLVDDTPPWGRHLVHLFDAQSYSARYGAITITDSANPAGYLRAATLLVEPVWQPVRNMAKDWERGTRLQGDPGVEQALRELGIPLHRLTPQEEREVQSLVRTLKGVGRLLVVPEPLSPASWSQDVIWAVFQGAARATAVDQRGRFRTLQLGFVEVDE